MISRFFHGLPFLIFCGSLLFSPPLAASGVTIQAKPLADGVVLWTPNRPGPEKPQFLSMFEEMANVVLPSGLPFGRSIAFLVGVGRYRNLEPLPFVRNDLKEMKDYLLLHGGFDQVYVASDEIVSANLIESYMMTKFPRELGERDRLLFYYAGHGADAQGTTGYLQFVNARRGDFANHVVAVARILEWGRVNQVSHMLFLLDTCSSGLAFTPRALQSAATSSGSFRR